MQNNHFSLIDHVLTNSPSTNTSTGVQISDISDHFFTITIPSFTKQACIPNTRTARNFSKGNIENFKLALRSHNWQATYACTPASSSFDTFWQDFEQHFNQHLPNCTIKSNKNRNKYLFTPELLESRKTKLQLHKLSLSNPTPENIHNYERHRNLYNTAVRQIKFSTTKPVYLTRSKILKKTWQILKEAVNLNTRYTILYLSNRI